MEQWTKSVIPDDLQLDEPKEVFKLVNGALENQKKSPLFNRLIKSQQEEFIKTARIAFATEIAAYLCKQVVKGNKTSSRFKTSFKLS